MEISRVDPYLVKWSADGTIALATESAGIQLLAPNCEDSLNSEVKLNRLPSPTSLNERVIDMQWSPLTPRSAGSCKLACVTISGDVFIFDVRKAETSLAHYICGEFASVCWIHGGTLLLGTNEGELHAYEDTAQVWRSGASSCRVNSIVHCADSGEIGVLTSDQKCWIVDKTRNWKCVANESETGAFVSSIAFISGQLVWQICGEVRTSDQKTHTLTNYLPGELLVHNNEFAVVHQNGEVSGSTKLGLPKIEGEVLGISRHPVLPLAVIVVGNDTATSKEWQYAILSSQSANIAIFALPGELSLPQINETAPPASWLALTLKPLDQQPFAKLAPPGLPSYIRVSSLTEELSRLFRSPWFDYQRYVWFSSPEDQRHRVEARMREAIKPIVQHEKPTTPLDQLVHDFYTGSSYAAFTLRGDFIVEEFTEMHSANASTLTSVNGRVWRRCALTLLPLLTLDTKMSLEGQFTCYRHLPSLVNGDNEPKSETNPLAEALISAASFCVFTGTCWK